MWRNRFTTHVSENGETNLMTNTEDKIISGVSSSPVDIEDTLVTIEAAYFYSGMYIDFGVYITDGNSYELLFNDVRIDDNMLNKLDRAESEGKSVCVTKSSYRKIIIGAAENAEKEGIAIDWESVYRAAEVFPDQYADSEEDAPEPEAVELPEIPEVPPVEPAPEKNNYRKLGFDDGPGPQVFTMESPDELMESIMRRTSGGNAPEKNTARNAEINAKKVADYVMLAKNIRIIFTDSSRKYRFNRALVEKTADEICRLVRTSSDGIVFEAMQALRDKEEYLVTHTQNTACFNALIGKWRGLSGDDLVTLAMTGIIHDIGEQQIAQSILFKPARLTPQEFIEIKKHPILSYRVAIASGITDESILMAVRHHHERFNGTGYPEGLSGGNIPFYARITAVSDAYDAMVTKKPYKEDYTPLDTLQEFSNIRNSELDGRIVELLLTNITRMLIGKRVLLSDGREGRIVSLNSSNYADPMVFVKGEYIRTNRYVKVTDVFLFDEDTGKQPFRR